YILCSVAAERKVLSQHFVENYAKTPDIRPQINHHSARLLRRHVTHGAKHYTLIGMNEWLGRGFPVECIYFRQLSNPEVEQLDIIFAVQGVVLLQHHNVFRLDVSMYYALGMCSRQRTRHLHRNVQDLTHLHGRAGQISAQRYAVEILGGDEMG